MNEEKEAKKKKALKINLLVIAVVLIIGTILFIERPFEKQSDLIPRQGKILITDNGVEQDTSNYPSAPEFAGISHWINSEPLKISDLRGKVVIVDFWTYSCINCIRTLPYIKDWYDKYHDDGLVIIGVHTPEFNFEKEVNNVEDAVKKFGIKYPVAMDNNYGTWDAYGNKWWPHKYIIDKNGRIKYDHIGEGNYAQTESVIVGLLKEINSSVEKAKSNVSGEGQSDLKTIFQTPELYAGYSFARIDIGNSEGYSPNKIMEYAMPESIMANRIYAQGKWKNNEDNLQHSENSSGEIILKYTAKSVNIVAGSAGYSQNENTRIDVTLDGDYLTAENAGSDVVIDNETGESYVNVGENRLYNLVGNQAGFSSHEIRISSDDSNFMLYTFTFGN